MVLLEEHEELKDLREADRVVYQWNERMAAASAVYHQELDHFLTEEQYGAMADVIEEGGTVFPSFPVIPFSPITTSAVGR